MDLPFDILDHIFGFLKTHPTSLIACSKAHPDLSPIAERHFYYHTIVHAGLIEFTHSLKPTCLLNRISDTPRIANHVRVLQVQFNHDHRLWPFEDISLLLPRLPVLECLMLSAKQKYIPWQKLPHSFRSAVEDSLHLPTLNEVHIGDLDFPLSILESTNINLLSLSGVPQISEYPNTIYPQLKSLSAKGIDPDPDQRFIIWARQCIGNLQSLECAYSDDEPGFLKELLKVCSETLETLDISLSLICSFSTAYYYPQVLEVDHGTPISISLSSLCHLQHLTIRFDMYFGKENSYNHICLSSLPAVMEILKTAPSLQHLNIEIYVDSDVGTPIGNLLDNDFSPLTALVGTCSPFHQIDLYVHSNTGFFTISELVSLFADYRGLIELIDQGTLVVHPKSAPAFLNTVHSRSTLVRHPRLPSKI